MILCDVCTENPDTARICTLGRCRNFFIRNALWSSNGNIKRREKNLLLGLIFASLVMTAGYTLAGAFLYDSLNAGLASTPGLLLKSAVNILVTITICAAIRNRGV